VPLHESAAVGSKIALPIEIFRGTTTAFNDVLVSVEAHGLPPTIVPE
jgi:hypothetical protein